MDAAQIVAVPVPARNDVVLAGQRQRALPPVAVPGGLARQPYRRQRFDPRHHRQGVEALNERVSSHIPNGSESRSCSGPSG